MCCLGSFRPGDMARPAGFVPPKSSESLALGPPPRRLVERVPRRSQCARITSMIKRLIPFCGKPALQGLVEHRCADAVSSGQDENGRSQRRQVTLNHPPHQREILTEVIVRQTIAHTGGRPGPHVDRRIRQASAQRASPLVPSSIS
jgi:hypothetical protein